jgi:hypothetical protein
MFHQKAEDSILFYRGVKSLEGNAEIEFEALKLFVKRQGDVKEKVSLSDFRKFQLTASN